MGVVYRKEGSLPLTSFWGSLPSGPGIWQTRVLDRGPGPAACLAKLFTFLGLTFLICKMGLLMTEAFSQGP